MDLSTLHAFEDHVRTYVPKFRVAFKDESVVQRILGFFVYPFNQQFMTNYTTTFYPVVYFPSRAAYEGSPDNSFSVLAHEMVHLLDTIRYPFWFRVSYALPQLFAVALLAAYGIVAGHHAWILALVLGGFVLGCAIARWTVVAFFAVLLAALIGTSFLAVMLTGGWSLLLFLGLALLAPWPSPGRTHWELRGYTMNLAILQWELGSVDTATVERIAKYFTGPAYFFMSWSKGGIHDALNDAILRARQGELQNEQPYAVVREFLAAKGKLVS